LKVIVCFIKSIRKKENGWERDEYFIPLNSPKFVGG
jgi:hypothetical protein